MPKDRRKLAREIGHCAQMLFKMMNLKGPIFIPTHMSKKVSLGFLRRSIEATMTH